eukprot:8856394-Alexandrium_andersonii.AAC.1
MVFPGGFLRGSFRTSGPRALSPGVPGGPKHPGDAGSEPWRAGMVTPTDHPGDARSESWRAGWTEATGHCAT